MTPAEFSNLLTKWKNGTISGPQAIELMQAIGTGHFPELVEDTFEGHLEADEFAGLLEVSGQAAGLEKWSKKYETGNQKIIHRVHFLRTAWFRVAVAILVILTGSFIYYKLSDNSSAGPLNLKVNLTTDILPGTNKATLTLSDGRKIELTNTSETITDGARQIKNLAGQLVYEPGLASGETERALSGERSEAGTAREGHIPGGILNTMTTPRGGQYQLVLPDGSRVWLNAASSITYPIAFNGKTREVKITGEAYFEIKPNKTQPFIVKTISDEIQVLGTSFNINAYNDAPVKTSLLEGKVKINTNILKPGQAFTNGKIIATNLEHDLAWKNGIFNFNNTDLTTALNQLRRWYNVEIVYEGNIPEKLIRGKMGRDLTLMQVLRILNGMGINTRLEGRKLLILSETEKK